MEFVTVFELASNVNEIIIDVVSICAFLLIFLLLLGFIRYKKKKYTVKTHATLSILSFVFLILFIFQITSLVNMIRSYNYFKTIFKQKAYRVCEGSVKLIQKAETRGPVHSDIVLIDGHQFEIKYSDNSVAYHKTIVRGGLLKENVYARIYYFENDILKIDMRK